MQTWRCSLPRSGLALLRHPNMNRAAAETSEFRGRLRQLSLFAILRKDCGACCRSGVEVAFLFNRSGIQIKIKENGAVPAALNASDNVAIRNHPLAKQSGIVPQIRNRCPQTGT